jgi:hypothetical protein
MWFIKSQGLLEQTQALIALANEATFLVKGLIVVRAGHKTTLAVKVYFAPTGLCNAANDFTFAVLKK